MSVSAIAAMNGLDPNGVLLAGTVIKLPTGAPAPARAAQPAPAADGRPGGRARADATRLGAGDVQSVASQHGVSPSLATAIAWQESGFNNAMVSSRQRARRDAGHAGHVGLRAAEPRARASSIRTPRTTT